MKTTVYKLVCHNDPDYKLVSLIVMRKAKKFYKPGKIQKAPKWLADAGYHLTAFKTLKDLEYYFKLKSTSMEVWECEATGVFDNLPSSCNLSDLSAGIISASYPLWPRGTVMCKTLKLIKEVK